MTTCLASILFLTSGPADAGSRYFGVYYLGKKIGYRQIDVAPDQVNGQPAIRSENKWRVSFNLLGQRVDRAIDATTWTTPDNRPLRDLNVTRSGKQGSTYQTTFGAKTAEVDIDTDGAKSHKSVAFPDGPVYEDIFRLIHKAAGAGQSFAGWTFASGDDAFSKVDLRTIGPSSYTDRGKPVAGTLTEVKNRGNTLRIYLGDDGAPLRQEWSTPPGRADGPLAERDRLSRLVRVLGRPPLARAGFDDVPAAVDGGAPQALPGKLRSPRRPRIRENRGPGLRASLTGDVSPLTPGTWSLVP